MKYLHFVFQALLLQGRESTGEEGRGLSPPMPQLHRDSRDSPSILPQLLQPVCAGGKLGKLGQGDDPTKAYFFF